MGQRVRVRLSPGSYTVRRDRIEFASIRVGDPPAAVFYCRQIPSDLDKPIVIIGTVERIESDGIPRYANVEHCVHIADCSVSTSP